MIKPTKLLVLLLFATGISLGQAPKKETVSFKIQQLKKLLNESDNLSPEMTDSLDINNKVKTQLTKILLAPGIGNYDLEKEFKDSNMSTTHSKDKRLWFFTWFENTGGSFKSNLTVIQYKTKDYKTGVEVDSSLDDGGFDSSGASYDQIIKLPSKTKNLYLCLGGAIGCGTCSAHVVKVIELTANDINLDYPAFIGSITDDSGDQVNGNVSTFIMDSRVDDIKTFEYDSKTQSIKYKYVPDDNTPITVEDGTYNPDAKPIVGYLKWNGTHFVETIVGNPSPK